LAASVVTAKVGDRQVVLAVAIEVIDYDGIRAYSSGVLGRFEKQMWCRGQAFAYIRLFPLTWFPPHLLQ
jgi:hypothetical protein